MITTTDPNTSTHDLFLHHNLIEYYDILKPESDTPINPLQTASLPGPASAFILVLTVLYSLLIVTSLVSNPLLIYVLLVRRKAQIKLIDIFVANLSLSDLFLTVFNIPLSLVIYFSDKWPFGTLLCQLATYSTSCSIYVNIFTMAYISIDRYFAITSTRISNPNCQRKKSILSSSRMRRKIYTALSIIWLVSLILSLPQYLFTKVSVTTRPDADVISTHGFQSELSEDPFKKCLMSYPFPDMKFYMTFVNFSCQYLIPLLVILYFYGKIIYHLYLNLNIAEFMESTTDLHSSKKTKSHSNYEFSEASASSSNYDKPKKLETIRFSNKSAFTLPNPKAYTRAPSRMQIEGLNRARNLKKSIKVMIIIIALFLLSWLPIHMYRLITTYVPLIRRQFYTISASNNPLTSTSLANNHTSTPLQALINDCQNSTDKYCIYKVISQEIEQIKLRDAYQSPRHDTLHNPYVFFICYFMSMSSVCYNPIVYFWMHKKFRNEVKQTFARLFHLGGFIRRFTGRILNSKEPRHNNNSCKSVLVFDRPKKSVKICNEKSSLGSAKRSVLAKNHNEEMERLVANEMIFIKSKIRGRNVKGTVIERNKNSQAIPIKRSKSL